MSNLNINVTVLGSNHSADLKITQVLRSELTAQQERAYSFSEKMLKKGTDILKVEARARLAANGLSFSQLYRDLDV